jgi:ATP-dependent Lon protease
MEEIEKNSAPLTVPLVPLRDVVIYPHMVTSLDIGREGSVAAVRRATKNDRYLAMIMQRDAAQNHPAMAHLYREGSVVKIKQLLQLPGGMVRILVEGISRIHLLDLREEDGCLMADIEDVQEKKGDPVLAETYRREIIKEFMEWTQHAKQNLSEEAMEQLHATEDPGETADFIASQLMIQPGVKQEILQLASVEKRLKKVKQLLDVEMEICSLEEKINSEVRVNMEKEQRDYYLRQKIKAIHHQLGDTGSPDEEADSYRAKLKALELPKEQSEKIEREISRLASMPPMMAESAVIRNYLDWIFDLPWHQESKDNLDLKKAQKILDSDHYGLDKIKERILEYLAVRVLSDRVKGPILCFVGPPGVGKTSLARSIARAMGREFARVSLGGIHDEAEIRGHRRTYIGAMPGRFIEAMAQSGTKNPVILLDEIDKIGNDFRGDPASALLEALDPEQNNTFNDNFIDMPFDMSHVFFITTANTMSTVPPALMDRMEVIPLSGYTEEEKLQIAQKYLVPKQLGLNGLTKEDIHFTPQLIRAVIQGYTREAGVRELERVIGSLCRKVGKKIVMKEEQIPGLTARTVEEYLGPVKFLPFLKTHISSIGRVTGLAWTQAGGEVLDTEAVSFKGKGQLILTGQLGDVMKESAQAAYTYVRSRAADLKLADDFYEKSDIHIHLPEGAIPKDGPSAGITMAVAMASAFTRRPVRSDTAMTGEITLTGEVLPVGGIKEKVLAASRFGIKQILMPADNKRDLEEIPDSVRKKLHFIFVKTMDEVLENALVK